MNIQRLFYKIIPACLVAVLLLTAGIVFVLKYGNTGFPLIYDTNVRTNEKLFYLNFFVPFFVCGTAIYACLFSSARHSRGVCMVIGFITDILCTFLLADLFAIKLCMYNAFIIMASIAFPAPKNCIISTGSILLFTLSLFHPSLLGTIPVTNRFVNPVPFEIIPAVTYMFLPAITIILLRFFIDKYIYDSETIKHLNSVGRKLVLFNHRLQELAKHSGEEAVRQERLRFTRDLHDSCGYAFTNIILVTDAATSRGEIAVEKSLEIFQQIRTLATKGLRETRDTLHLIRKIQEPYMQGIETVFQLKRIFEETTGIQVDIEWGNMKNDYGSAVNQVLARIIQEAFTNSIRHGMATRISIQFWEFTRKLSMTVTDNGIGASVIVKGIGLAGMEERLESVGGNLEVSLPPEGGFRLGITIPLVGNGFVKATV
jgi:signal transduction histidine kinase